MANLNVRIAANIDGLKKTLAEGQSAVQVVTAGMQRLSTSLDGNKLFQRATDIVGAVQKIGGATKLTTAEKERFNRTLQQAIEKYQALGKEAPKAMVQLEKATRAAEQPVAGITTKMIALGAAAGSFIGHMAYDAVKALGRELLELSTNGVKLAPIVSSFQSLTSRIGETSNAMLGSMRSATRGLVTDLELMGAANKAMLLGLPVTSASMGTLASAAVTLGRAMKQDASKSFDDLITALGRSSPMILDNLGLTVKVGEANELYARQVGKSADALTDAEKKIAFYNAAMAAADEKVKTLGGVQLTLADHVTRATNALKNFTDGLGVAIARSPVLAAGVGSVADSLDRAFGGNQVTRIQSLIGTVNSLAISIVDVAQMGITAAGWMGRGWDALKVIVLGFLSVIFSVGSAFSQIVAGAAALASTLPGVGSQFDGVAASARDFATRITGMQHSLHDQAAAALEGVKGNSEWQRSLEGASTTLGEMRARMVEASRAQVEAATIADTLTQTTNGAATANGALSASLSTVGAAAAQAAHALGPYLTAQERMLILSKQSAGAAFSFGMGLNRQPLADPSALVNRAGPVTTSMIYGLPAAIGSQGASRGGASAAGPGFLGSMSGFIGNFAKGGGMTDMFASAFMGGGGLAGGAKSIGTTILSKALNFVPIVGPLISSFAGPIVSGISKLFGGGEGKKVNDMRDKFFAQFGGFEGLAGKSGMTEDLMKKVFNAKSVKDFEAAVKSVETALGGAEKKAAALEQILAKYNVTWADFQGPEQAKRLSAALKLVEDDFKALTEAGLSHETALLKVKDGYLAIAQQALAAGQEIPDALAPALLDLAKMGALTEAQAAALLGMAGTAGPSFDQVKQAAERYGLVLDELGSKIGQLNVNDSAGKLTADFDLLMQAGANTREVIAGMSDQVNEVIRRALSMGVSVPASMREMLQKFVDAGQLTDENGEKLKDLSRINFAEPLEGAVQRLIEKLSELIAKIGAAGSALSGLPGLPVPTPLAPPDKDLDGPHMMAAGGLFTVSRPTMFIAGERGTEQAAFSGAGRSFGGGGRSDDRLIAALERLFDRQARDLVAAAHIARGRGASYVT